DWIQFVPSGNPPGADPFNLFEDPGVINEISAFDLVNMNVLGWNLVPVVKPNPPPPAGTTADMILRRGSDGFYEIYDIGNNAILAGYLVGQVGTTWQFAGLGGFVGNDTTDMLLRNANTGGFEVYDLSNNNITNAAFLGNGGLDWQVMGFGNFSSRGETDMIREQWWGRGLRYREQSDHRRGLHGHGRLELAVLGRRQFQRPWHQRHDAAQLEY